MKKRPTLSVLLALTLILVFTLGACGGEPKSSGSEPSSSSADAAGDASSEKSDAPEETEDGEDSAQASGASVTAPANVQVAMNAAESLTTGNYFLLEDGSVLTTNMDGYALTHDFGTVLASTPNVKKIVDSSSELEIFALTESGELFYRDVKVLDGVKDMIYKTNNANQEAYAIGESDIYLIYADKTSEINAALRGANPDNYIDLDNGETVVCYPGQSELFLNGDEAVQGADSLGAEMSDFFVVSGGRVYRNMSFPEDYEGTPSIDSWENVVLFDAQKVKLSARGDSERKVETTAAAILADGSVVAEGAYAEDILSWGELSYLSMSGTAIVGLTPDGTLKVSGSDAEAISGELAQWKDIVAVRVGGTGKVSCVVNAVDKAGTFYHLQYDESKGPAQVVVVNPDNGLVNDGWHCFKYCPDGTVYRCIGENGAWELYEDD